MDTKKTSFQTSRLKVFFFFLILAMVYWGLTKFSKDYTTEVTAAVKFTEIPKTALLTQDNMNEISFDLTATGFQLLYYKLKQPEVSLPISAHYIKGDSLIVLPSETLRPYVVKSMDDNSTVANLSVSSISIFLDGIVQKKVPIIAMATLDFKEGYQALGSLRVVPDSIVLSGPSHTLDTIAKIETIPFEIENIERSISEKMSLQLPKQEKVTVAATQVQIVLEVDEFSQQTFSIPITLINMPVNEKIKMIPNRTEISFSVSLKDFNRISAADFELICDYSLRNTEENFMLAELKKVPGNIRNIEIAIKKIDFLLFK